MFFWKNKTHNVYWVARGNPLQIWREVKCHREDIIVMQQSTSVNSTHSCWTLCWSATSSIKTLGKDCWFLKCWVACLVALLIFTTTLDYHSIQQRNITDKLLSHSGFILESSHTLSCWFPFRYCCWFPGCLVWCIWSMHKESCQHYTLFVSACTAKLA